MCNSSNVYPVTLKFVRVHYFEGGIKEKFDLLNFVVVEVAIESDHNCSDL
jgi:hypothetical protein